LWDHHAGVVLGMPDGPVLDPQDFLTDLGISVRVEAFQVPAHHAADDPFLGDLAFIEPEGLDGLAVADDGDGVCDFADFVEFVADDDAGDSLALQVEYQVQEVAGVFVVECRRGLVQDEELDFLG
jgi:hypothetical protein